jgi:uncharacterized protein YcbK (DUF882 family)
MLYRDSTVENRARRAFLRSSFLSASLVCGGELSYAAAGKNDASRHPLHRQGEVRKLKLANDRTGEVLETVYWRNYQYVADNVGQLNYFMRDFHADKSYLMDLKLYDFLYKLQQSLETTEHIHVLSAYRTPGTNSELRKQSIETAVRSFHMKGQAVDFYIPGVDLNVVQKTARSLVMGGVGYYPSAGFVHIDTGFARHWKKA